MNYQRNKKILKLLIMLLLIFTLFGMTKTETNATIGGTSGNCSWVIDDDGVLTIRPTNGVEGTLGIISNEYSIPWSNIRDQIKEIKFEGKVYRK